MKRLLLCLSLILSSIITQAQWGPLGSGLTGRVKALTVFNGEIYAGGTFTSPNHVARWDAGSNTWVTAGNGLSDSVNALVVHNGKLYAGGHFITNGSGAPVLRIAVLNTSTNSWDQVGSGLNNFIRALFSDGADLYIGGAFNNSGSPAVSRIAKFNGSTFSQVGDNPGNVVNTISKYNSAIFIGGAFPGFVRKLSGASWQSLSGLNNDVYALCPFNGYLYIGGAFTSPWPKIAKFDGSSVGSAFNTLNNSVFAFLATPYKLFAGGAFTLSPSTSVSLPHFLAYNGSAPFFAEGSGFNGDILAITNFNGKIVVGGSFAFTGSTSVNSVAISAQTIDVAEVAPIVSDKVFYPNPMTEISTLRIETTEMVKNPVLKIVDSNSRLVENVIVKSNFSNNRIEFQISREGMAAGNYFYLVEDENGNGILSDMFVVE